MRENKTDLLLALPSTTPMDSDSPAAGSQSVEDSAGEALPEVRFASLAAIAKTGIEIASAEFRNMDEFLVANGVVSYDRTRLAELSIRVPGRVFRVEKRVGEPVRQGDVLAIIEAAEVGRAKADFVEALVLHKLAAETLTRLSGVQNVISVRDLHEAKGKCELARVRRFNSRQALANLGLPVSLEEFAGLSEEEAAQKLHFLGLPASCIASLDAAACSANLIPLTAPFDAIVTDCRVVVGEMVSPEIPQFLIGDVSRMWLELDVRQEDARKLQLGQQILFSVNGGPDEIPSTLTWIGTEIDAPREPSKPARKSSIRCSTLWKARRNRRC